MTKEIVSNIKDTSLALEVTAAEAKAAGRFAYSKPTPENSIVLFIDHQLGLLASNRFPNLSELKDNVLGLAETAKALDIPVLISSSNAQWQNGDTIPELKDVFPDEPIYRRTGIINAYEDPSFRNALKTLIKETGRDHIIVAGVPIGTCCVFPTLSLLNDGYQVFPVIDACGAWSQMEYDAATQRMANAGAELESTFALACELQADWKKPSGDAMLKPFRDHLSEYGYVIENYWNNANGHTVEDPFGQVK
ncbi:isochorismatase family protein [uncultured Secundilactobacillus sp.]|uniref:isochorismatase family protein n=1 Tax=uncultured Secundilactobacillus sp. TaxID=2813935 RepID=UPI00259009F9|nr:isochorismatase family protein [uncultured Secundilactobacillus sp.]